MHHVLPSYMHGKVTHSPCNVCSRLTRDLIWKTFFWKILKWKILLYGNFVLIFLSKNTLPSPWLCWSLCQFKFFLHTFCLREHSRCYYCVKLERVDYITEKVKSCCSMIIGREQNRKKILIFWASFIATNCTRAPLRARRTFNGKLHDLRHPALESHSEHSHLSTQPISHGFFSFLFCAIMKIAMKSSENECKAFAVYLFSSSMIIVQW